MTARLGILLSGSGSTYANLQAQIQQGTLDAEIALVIASRPQAGGLQQAADWGHPWLVSRDQETIQQGLVDHGCDWVAMCGFMSRFDPRGPLSGRVLNVHPSLLPAFGGQGFYGDHVHRAVLQRGARVSGCTVHLVAGDYDSGPILAQRIVPVHGSDSVESLRQRVQAAERHLYPLVLQSLICHGYHGSADLTLVNGCDAWDLGFTTAPAAL
ncbi:MAG: phosphoribosylglycinamide formyltransferase [Planctomycetota bacterium]|nr:MAG: phosphoribosylglycinamide formyltransferase [Planctomycetota bacterium]